MARKPRIEVADALYHVLCRGNQKQNVFRSKSDFVRYLDIVAHYKRRYPFSLYAYVLMKNHVHLLIEMKETPLSKIMQGINQRYTMYFNKKYQMVGHLFQGRYKAILCDKDEYLLTLVKYIHANPVRAGVAESPEAYPWSSHASFLGVREDDCVDAAPVLEMFSEDPGKAVQLYAAHMEDAASVPSGEMYKVVDQRILGDERFVDRVFLGRNERPKTTKRRHEYTLEEVAREVAHIYNISVHDLRGKSKEEKVLMGRKLLSVIAKELEYKGTEIATFLGKDPATISKYLRDTPDIQEEMKVVVERVAMARVNNQV